VEHFEKVFASVHVLGQTENFLNLKIAKEGVDGQVKSIGFVFGEIEHMVSLSKF